MRLRYLAPASVAAVLVLAGCSGTGASPDAGDDGGGEIEEGATLSVLHYLTEQPKLDGLDELVAGFNEKYPDVTVNVEATSLDQYGDTLKLRASGGEMPDIVFGNPKTYSEFVDEGLVRDLTDLAAVETISSEYIDSTSLDGKVYGVPLALGAAGVFYNVDLFEQAGLEVPTTWPEFVNVLETLDAEGITPLAAGYADVGTFGGAFYTDIYGTPSSQDPNWRADVEAGERTFEELGFFKESWERFAIRNQYVNDDAVQVGLDESEQIFARGDAAMVMLGTWGLAPIRSYNPEGNFGFFMLPTQDVAEDNLMMVYTDDNWMASSTSQYPNAQAAFLEYMTSVEGGEIWANAIQGISTVDGAVVEEVDPMTADVQALVDTGKVWNFSSTDDFSGQFLDAWFAKLQEFPVTPKWQDDIDAYVASFDTEFDRIRESE